MRMLMNFSMGSSDMVSARTDDPTRYYAEAMKMEIDSQGPSAADNLPLEMPTTYATRNRETTGAVTSS